MIISKGIYTISDLHEFILTYLAEGEQLDSEFQKRDLKQMLLEEFGDSITITPNVRKNESDLVYSSEISPADLAIKLKNLNVYDECGSNLRKLLMNVTFGLNDSFCDADDLEEAWRKTVMPSEMVSMFSALCKIPKYKLLGSPDRFLDELIAGMNDSETTTNENESTNDEKSDLATYSERRLIQLHCLFQVMVNIVKNGRESVPLHVMVGQECFSRDRSKTHITNLNHIGVSESYTKVKARRNLLMGYTIQEAADDIPIPSNMTKDEDDFAQVACDNSNYLDRSSLSGTEMLNYSASCMYQDKTKGIKLKKPSVSSTKLNPRAPLIRSELECQKVQKYIKPKEKPALPESFITVPEARQPELLDMDGARREAHEREFMISLVRVGLSEPSHETPIWQAVHTSVSNREVPLARVGFLPVIPKPITDASTVRQLLVNFENVRKQLGQPTLPIWQDEGVFDILVDLYIEDPEEFKNLFPAMGPFHWGKVLQRVNGKLMRGSGFDDAFVEAGVFGSGVFETVLNGGHYYRSLAGNLLLDDIITYYQWRAFWSVNNKESYPCLPQIEQLKEKLFKNVPCPDEFEKAIESAQQLYEDFHKFKKEAEEKSQVCEYTSLLQHNTSLQKNLLSSEREGNWDLLVATIDDSMPVLREFDCLNYLKNGG